MSKTIDDLINKAVAAATANTPAEKRRLQEDAAASRLLFDVENEATRQGAWIPAIASGFAREYLEYHEDKDGRLTARINTGVVQSPAVFVMSLKGNPDTAAIFRDYDPTPKTAGITFQGKSINNPWKKETRNLTLQAQISDKDSSLAAKLKAEAGL